MRFARKTISGAALAVVALCTLSAGAPGRAGAAEEHSTWDAQARLTELTLERRARETERAEREKATARPSPLSDPMLRAALIATHRPVARTSGLLPRNALARVFVRWGSFLSRIGIHENAREAYASAIAFGRDDAPTWRDLGAARMRTGDLDGAEASFLAALDRIDEAARPKEAAAVSADLATVYLLERKTREAERALARAVSLAPHSARIRNLLARARYELAPEAAPRPTLPIPLWVESDAERLRDRWQDALERAHAAMPAPLQRQIDRVPPFALESPGRWILAGALAVLLAAWLVVRRIRGRGDLAITIAYPVELAGSFSVRLASQPGKFKRAPKNSKAGVGEPDKASTRTARYGVSRETQFQALRAQLYYVTIEGVLRDPGSSEIVTNPFDEQAVKVVPDQVTHIDFDVAPRESVVDVRVSWNKQPARDAAVAARGFPQSLRYARDGATRLRLRKGTHTIVIGCGDRVAECEVELDSFRAESIEIDLGTSEKLIFKGCPPAVGPYVHGDLGAASRALEGDGHTDLANLLLAKLHHEQGATDRAAHHFELAGRPLEAAELHAALEHHEIAAGLFRQVGAMDRAGEMLRAAGELIRAGECFEAARDYESAIACFQEAGEVPRWIDAVERSGAVFDAAKLAVEHGDRSRTIRLLQRLPSDHPNHPEALEMLANAYLQEGHRDLAVSKIEERLSTEDSPSTDLRFLLADLLEQEGDIERALEVLSALRELDPTYPNVATKIEALRKRQSERELSDSRGNGAAKLAPTAFLAESRYEILEEIGRGGMGVVLKARDTRLERMVALKRLPETLREHPKAIALFLREAQSAARLNHPNIVTVYDTDQQDGIFFITMEILEGTPIGKLLHQRGRFSVRNTAQLGMQIAAGLSYAHNKGVVHRDIKSANLFFTRDRVVKIMDFGLAKMIEEVRRGTTVIGGTPYYMAPEQAAGEKVDQRADIYAFGVTLYEFLTGRVPFHEGDVAYHHRHTPVPDPRERVASIPAAMADLVLQMLQKNPEDRIGTAAEVSQKLGRIIAATQ